MGAPRAEQELHPIHGGSGMLVVGLSSGTSFDAVDAAVCEIDLDAGELQLRPVRWMGHPMPDELRARLAAALPPHPTSMEEVCRLDCDLGQLFAAAAVEVVSECRLEPPDLVACHGQTVFHLVERGQARASLQLGAPAWIAAATGLPVVSDFRSADIAAGGQGAPLAALLDSWLLADLPRPWGALNLGGIANMTIGAADGSILAYDLGPANALLDAAMGEATGGRERMDRDGALARRGRCEPGLLRRLLDDPYYQADPPKSTGKERYNASYLRARAPWPPGPLPDVLATLIELTAELVAGACARFGLREVVVSGGGVRNPALMERIELVSVPTRYRRSDELGIPAEAKEACLFALLGFLTVQGLPGNLPEATGARQPVVLGSLTPGVAPLVLPPPAKCPPRRLRVQPSS